MNKKTINELKKKLAAEQALLEKDLLKFSDKDKKIPYNYETRYPELDAVVRPSSLDENAAEIENYDNLVAVEHALELRLKEVSESLDKIKNNNDTYGKCEMCKQDIELRRLKANPAAKICLKCINNKNK